MRLPQMTMRRWMVVMIASALILAPFAWTAPELRWGLFITLSSLGLMGLVVASLILHRLARWMAVVIVAALVLRRFIWTVPGSPWLLFIGFSTVGLLLLIVASPFLLDLLGRDEILGPRTGLARGSASPVRPRPIRRLSRKW